MLTPPQELSYAEEEVYARSNRTITPDSSRPGSLRNSKQNSKIQRVVKNTLAENSDK